MGVDLWVTRQAVHTQQIEYPIYRDQTPDEALFGTSQPQLSQSVQALHSSSTSVAPSPHNLADAAKILLKQQPDPVQVDPRPQAEQDQTQNVDTGADEDLERPPLHIDAFEVQAYVSERCVLLLEGSALSAEQLRLWANIQAVEAGQYFELKWPFPLAQYQDGRGASMYIQGFINGLAQDKPIISLGEIPHLTDTAVQALASLQQMLEQPLLKRDVWQAMQGLR